MNPTPARPLLSPDAEAILQELSTRQFVRPHRPLAEALAEAGARIGYCEAVAVRAIAWLALDPSTAIGRLKRAELAQLARCIHRFWRQTLAAEMAASIAAAAPGGVVTSSPAHGCVTPP